MAAHEELGMTIRKARLDKSMSLGQLASAVGRSSSSVRRWERGEVMPAASVLPKLSAILEIDPQLLKEESKPTPSDTTNVPHGSAGVDGRVSTVEQPVIPGAGSGESSTSTETEAASSSGGGVLRGSWTSLTRGDRGWMGWVRGLLTVAVLIGMLFILLWALGELFDALGGVIDSFDVGSNGQQSP